MKLQTVGLSKSDLSEIETVLGAEVESMEDENGAPPPKTTGSPPAANPDYVRYIQLARMVHACNVMRTQVEAYDTAGSSDTNPAVVMVAQVGGF